MKKLIAIACLFITHLSFGLNNPSPELRKEITKKLSIDLSEIQLSQNREDFVLAEFTFKKLEKIEDQQRTSHHY